jgi:hypothetical protein
MAGAGGEAAGMLNPRRGRPVPLKPLKELASCIFCGGQPVTHEHVWSRWSHRYLPKGKNKWFAFHGTEYPDRTDIEIVKHPGDPLDWKVACVDERCNNGWMRELENVARPILIPLIQGDETPRFFGQKERSTIAAWVALKATIQEHAPRGNTISHHTQLRRLWKRRLAPEDTWRIWLGRYDGDQPDTLWASHPMLIIPPAVAKRRKDLTANYYNSQAATYVIGKLFIHLIRSPHQNLVRYWTYDPSIVIKLRRIWPASGFDTAWPPDPLSIGEGIHVKWALRMFARG